MSKYKYDPGDGFTMCFCGVLGVISSILVLLVGVLFDCLLFGIFGYAVLMTLSILSFVAAYAIKAAEVKDYEERSDDAKVSKQHIFEVESYYTECFKEVG